MLAPFVIVLPENFELEFLNYQEAKDFLAEINEVSSPYRGLYGVSDDSRVEIREVAYHITPGGMSIRYFVD